MSSAASPSPLIQLSTKGLANIRLPDDDTFVFLVGNVLHACPIFVAQFISPRVSRLQRHDSTLRELVIPIPHSGSVFEQILRLGTGDSLSVDSGEVGTFLSLCEALENTELRALIRRHFVEPESLTVENMCDVLRARLSAREDFSEALTFLSSHLSLLSDDAIDSLTDTELGLILRDESLVAPSEDWLYGCISRRFESDLGSASLLEFLHFEFLSISSIEQFIEWSLRNSIDSLGGVWRALSGRLLIDVCEFVKPRFSPQRGVVCNFETGRPLDGIIAHLTRRCGGNAADRGVVAVTASSVNSQTNAAKNVLNLTGQTRYGSKRAPGQWICIDFKDSEVAVAHYSIRSQFNAGVDAFHPKSWVLEGSMDGSVWTEFDAQRDNSQLNGQNLTATWATKRSKNVRYVRLRQTGPNHARNDEMWLSGIELFGTLYEP
jgi:hypothetical protein